MTALVLRVLSGANGAGKSSTLRAISGVVPYTGKVTYRGKPLNKIPADKIVALGIAQVPEGRGIFGSPFVGFKWFNQYLTTPSGLSTIANTLRIGIYSLLAGFPIPILLAIGLTHLRSGRYRRVVQHEQRMRVCVIRQCALHLLQLRWPEPALAVRRLGEPGAEQHERETDGDAEGEGLAEHEDAEQHGHGRIDVGDQRRPRRTLRQAAARLRQSRRPRRPPDRRLHPHHRQELQ